MSKEKESQAIFIQNKCGTYAVVDNEHMFRINRKEPHNNIQYWRCRKFSRLNKETGCHAAIVMDMDGFVKSHSDHTHPPNPAEVQTAIQPAKTFDPTITKEKRKADQEEKKKKRKQAENGAMPKSSRVKRICMEARKKVSERAVIRSESTLAFQQLQKGKSFREVAQTLGYILASAAPSLPKENPVPPPLPPPRPKANNAVNQTRRQVMAESRKAESGQNVVLARYVTQMSYDTASQISDALKNLGIMSLTPGKVADRLRRLGFERIAEEDEATGQQRQRWLQRIIEVPEQTEAEIDAAEEEICKTMKLLLPKPSTVETSNTRLPLLSERPTVPAKNFVVVVRPSQPPVAPSPAPSTLTTDTILSNPLLSLLPQ